MNLRLSDLGQPWQDMLDGLADFQADILRRRAAQMADELDREAQRAIEGAREWRELLSERSYRT